MPPADATPTSAQSLSFPLERRRGLGNWQDCVTEDAGAKPVREPMAVRYSAHRLEACATVQRICFSAAMSVCGQVSPRVFFHIELASEYTDKSEAVTAQVQDGPDTSRNFQVDPCKKKNGSIIHASVEGTSLHLLCHG